MIKKLLLTLSLFYSVLATAQTVEEIITPIIANKNEQSGLYILERGVDSLLARGWLTEHATKSISVQYFIWSKDPVGIIATKALVDAAERGVKVRILVDDYLLKTGSEDLEILDSHPNIEIKIYNAVTNVGVTFFDKVINMLSGFKEYNQRMHDKVFIADNLAGITGGRNMADEYFDFDLDYTFRDRDILVIGPGTNSMQNSFDLFWNSELTKSISQISKKEVSEAAADKFFNDLEAYAGNPQNYPADIAETLKDLAANFPAITNKMIFSKFRWVFDLPGKSKGGFESGGRSTDILKEVISTAKTEILIQSPYLVFDQATLDFFKDLISQGVKVKISTNSLESNDNLLAFSGYHKRRQQLLQSGIEIYEYRAHPQITKELMQRYSHRKQQPIFAIHAKSFVVDRQIAYIGTFNFDPRSMNLNTEVGVLIENQTLAGQLAGTILTDMSPDNSYNLSNENPDKKVSWWKRLKLFLLKLLPLEKVL